MMDLGNRVLNMVLPPASLVILAFAWPALIFIGACERLWIALFGEEMMEDKVVIITGASSGIGEDKTVLRTMGDLIGIDETAFDQLTPQKLNHVFLTYEMVMGEQIAYEYAKRGANLVLVARRENRLRGISENARLLGAKNVLITAADVVKEQDCTRFITKTVNFFGRVDHLVNTASLGHTFYFEEATDSSVFPILMDINFWGNVYPTYVALPYLRQHGGRIVVNASVENWMPLPRMSLYSAAKAALVNFYETLRLEVEDSIGITVATHGWIGTEMTRGKIMVEEGAEMQWKEEREVLDQPP
ncbi:unnamed protein product [Cuscuta campestris]|uniref:11-beta-hydroxysteroid dehydrogenase-like 5 n=1 Tax=Cuscuta campestris TaxID=132261 RepID=A0A484M6V4_9ASTE|nr:unnamed protein product [Cuscuta campestris]